MITRGKLMLPTEPITLFVASMRPRVITRGKASTTATCASACAGFNEAARDHARKDR